MHTPQGWIELTRQHHHTIDREHRSMCTPHIPPELTRHTTRHQTKPPPRNQAPPETAPHQTNTRTPQLIGVLWDGHTCAASPEDRPYTRERVHTKRKRPLTLPDLPRFLTHLSTSSPQALETHMCQRLPLCKEQLTHLTQYQRRSVSTGFTETRRRWSLSR